MSERNYAFEALADVTGTDWNAGRGELNAALKSIREQTEIADNYILADLIHERAKLYREAMPDVMLTPTALAKHWKRVYEETARQKRAPARTNQSVDRRCETCAGDRFVLVSRRPVKASPWMLEHEIEPAAGEAEDEYAPCPDCNAHLDTTFRRPDGTQFRTPDPTRTRTMMRG